MSDELKREADAHKRRANNARQRKSRELQAAGKTVVSVEIDARIRQVLVHYCLIGKDELYTPQKAAQLVLDWFPRQHCAEGKLDGVSR